MATVQYILTSRENPWDYFTQFDEWFRFERDYGYNSCGIVAAIAKTSPKLSDEINTMITNQAIDEFLANDILNVYKKVSRSTQKSNETAMNEIKNEK